MTCLREVILRNSSRNSFQRRKTPTSARPFRFGRPSRSQPPSCIRGMDEPTQVSPPSVTSADSESNQMKATRLELSLAACVIGLCSACTNITEFRKFNGHVEEFSRDERYVGTFIHLELEGTNERFDLTARFKQRDIAEYARIEP